MKRFLPLLLIIGISCSPNSEISNRENFKNWLKKRFNEDITKADYFPGGEGNYYLAKDIEIKSWETYKDGSKGAEAVIIAYPLPYFQTTPALQDSLINLKSFHSTVNVEYAICYTTISNPNWGLLIGSWEVDKVSGYYTKDVYLNEFWGGYEDMDYYKECRMEASKQQFLYQKKHAMIGTSN